MGIQGLMSYVGSEKNFFSDLQLRNTKIIIDGNNLYHKLYFDSGFNLQLGGDYGSFTEIVHTFFESLARCGIHAYVALDGGCDISDKKLQTQMQRAKDKIRMANNLSKGEGGNVLPLLVREVFIQVLRNMQVPFVQCFSEADGDIVTLANRWSCPVLSLDSDFCIFDLKAGYCPLSYFQWQNIVTLHGKKECYIPARCFSAERFCSHFNNMNMSLLPLFAVLSGNDYINVQALETFFSKVHLPMGASSHSGRKHARIHALLNWLSAFADAEEAMGNVLKYLPVQDRKRIRELLCSAMEEYNLSDTNLEGFFQRGSYVSPTAMDLKLPDWVQGALARGQLSPFLSDALVLRRTFLHTQVENMQRPSAHLITQPIRSVIYGLLLNSPQNLESSCKTANQPNTPFVVEFTRLETTLRKSNVETAVNSRSACEDLSLHKLPEVSLANRLKLLLDTLEVNRSVLESVPPAHRLTVAVTCYWVSRADPKVKLHHLKALIMGIVCGDIHKMLNKPERQRDGIRLVYDQLWKIKQSEVQKRSPDLEDMHIFCQWQCCLQMGLHLNQLLSTPLLEPDITRLYSGTLVHQLSQALKSVSSTEDLFNASPPLKKLYQDCIAAVMSAIPQDCFQNKSKTRSCKSKKGKKAAKAVENAKEKTMQCQPNCEVGNKFASLALED
ncbi:hypothetical protein FKM82_006885 [Ascaphus truei]